MGLGEAREPWEKGVTNKARPKTIRFQVQSILREQMILF